MIANILSTSAKFDKACYDIIKLIKQFSRKERKMFFRKSSLITAFFVCLVYLLWGLALGIISAPVSSHGVEAAASNQRKETFLHYFEAAQFSVRQESVLGWGSEINVQKECQFLTEREPWPVFCLHLYQKDRISDKGPALRIVYLLIGYDEPQDYQGEEIALITVKRDVLDVACANENCSKLTFLFSGWFVDSIEWTNSVPDESQDF